MYNVRRIILYIYVLVLSAECYSKKDRCLTGYMTDVQSWVDEKGVLTDNVGDRTLIVDVEGKISCDLKEHVAVSISDRTEDNVRNTEHHAAIDLSANSNPVPILQQKMTIMRFSDAIHVKYLSLARCRLNRVPTVFQFRDSQGRNLAETVEYMTFYGNSFQDISTPGALYDVTMNATNARERIVGMGYQRHSNAVWSTGLKDTEFLRLKELDLRACSIQVLGGNIFEGMSVLEALYIGENEIVYIDANAFSGLDKLIHLDFSSNEAYDDIGNFKSLTTETFYVLEHMKSLASLDFSNTRMSHRHTSMFKVLGPNLTRMSLCDTGLTDLEDDFFNQTSLRILDLSWNNGILSRMNVLRGLENTLEVLYAKDTGLRSSTMFKNFTKLDLLAIPMNELTMFNESVARTLKSLRILDIDKNRFISWFEEIFSLMPNLELLSLRDNNINVVSEEMIRDMANITYVALSGNFIVCNCHARDFFDLALQNEQYYHEAGTIEKKDLSRGPPVMTFHRGYKEFNMLIKQRVRVNVSCSQDLPCYEDLDEDVKGNFLLLDFHPSTYMCLHVPDSKSIQFHEVVGCNRMPRIDYEKEITKSRNMLYALLALPILLVILAVGFIFRRNIRYCYITMRNSALLSVINKNEVLDDNAIFHYDVFVSYCNEDRNWVLDHLLTHLEKDCNVNACLHERDFQVGHSILENIVSCMDRSRSIMLIISQKFLLSQWCQFEMHLAQHRLLETRREDLTLVLLEEIPRRLRPNTLHYLMLTKTYIVWPKNETERPLFWKRLKKSLTTIKMKQIGIEGVSLA